MFVVAILAKRRLGPFPYVGIQASGRIESGSGSPLEKPSNKSSETNAGPSEDPEKIIEFCNVGSDTTETVSDADHSRISSQYTHPLTAIMLEVKDPLTGPDCGFIVFWKRRSRHGSWFWLRAGGHGWKS